MSRIEREYEASDQRRYFVPCPHCGAMQWLRFERLRWEKGRPETAAYWCEHCEQAIPEHHSGATLQPEMIRSATFYCGTRSEKRDVGGVIFTSLIADYVKLDFPFGLEGSRGQPHPPPTPDEDRDDLYG